VCRGYHRDISYIVSLCKLSGIRGTKYCWFSFTQFVAFSFFLTGVLSYDNQNGEVRDNPRAILEILDENESDNESIFSGNSNNYEPQENEDSDENNGIDEQPVNDEDTYDEHASTDGRSKYGIR
jgi:hypothetical protein